MGRRSLGLPGAIMLLATAPGCQESISIGVVNGCGVTIAVDAEEDESRLRSDPNWRQLAPGEAREVRAVTDDAEEVFVAVRSVGIDSFVVAEMDPPDRAGVDLDTDVVVRISGDRCPRAGD